MTSERRLFSFLFLILLCRLPSVTGSRNHCPKTSGQPDPLDDISCNEGIEMPEYKLTYFDGRGRAEIIRLVFAAAGVAFEDHRLTNDEWAKLKPTSAIGCARKSCCCSNTDSSYGTTELCSLWPNTMELAAATPMGQVPLLETEGITLCQSLAIARFLARKFGLAGKTELDHVKVDMIVDSVDDASRPVPQFWRYETDETKKAQLRKTYIEETLPTALNNFDKLLKANNNGDGYFVGDSLTWADLQFYTLQGRLELMAGLTNPFEKFPKLKALIDRVTSQPKIAEYIAKRPKSDF